MDTPQNPCIVDQVRKMRRQIVLNVTGSKFTFFNFLKGYSNLKCAEEFLAKTVGCSNPWTNIDVKHKKWLILTRVFQLVL